VLYDEQRHRSIHDLIADADAVMHAEKRAAR
jgi:hypothetical protein